MFSAKCQPFCSGSICASVASSDKTIIKYGSLITEAMDSFKVSLHNATDRQIAWVRLGGLGKNGGNSYLSHEPTIHCDWGNPSLYLNQPIWEGWCQIIRSHVLYNTDSPTATRLGLCSSLLWQGAFQKHLWALKCKSSQNCTCEKI